jgi:hypothetical protein
MKAKDDKNFIHVHRLTPKECGNNTGTVDFKHLTISGEFKPNTQGVGHYCHPTFPNKQNFCELYSIVFADFSLVTVLMFRLHDLPVWRGGTQKFHNSLLYTHGMVDG